MCVCVCVCVFDYTLLGEAMLNSLVHTVATPRKNPGRDEPSATELIPSMSTYVAKPSGYISDASGMKTPAARMYHRDNIT